MRKQHWWALAALTATLGVFLVATVPALSQKPPEKLSLKQTLAKKTKLNEEDIAKVLEALGPAIRDQLSSGETVALPGLGTIRVVRIPEHKDMVQGRPAMIAATNNVELLPAEEVVQAANSPGAIPAVTVPPFEFNPLPGQTRIEKVPYVRQPNTRTK